MSAPPTGPALSVRDLIECYADDRTAEPPEAPRLLAWEWGGDEARVHLGGGFLSEQESHWVVTGRGSLSSQGPSTDPKEKP